MSSIIKIWLNEPYTWGNPEKLCSSNCNFIRSNKPVKYGQIVTFEEMDPYSEAGELNVDHYQYYAKRSYEVKPSSAIAGVTWPWSYDLVEIKNVPTNNPIL